MERESERRKTAFGEREGELRGKRIFGESKEQAEETGAFHAGLRERYSEKKSWRED